MGLKITGNFVARSVYAGFVLAVAGIINLLMENRIAGALFFTIGLTSIFLLQAYLFTGAVGNAIVEHRRGWLPWLLAMLGANLLGSLIGGLLVPYLYQGPELIEAAAAAWDAKLSQDGVRVLVSSSFCGFLVYVAWKANTKAGERPVLSWFVVVLCIMIFVLARFEHSIASAFLMFASGSYDLQSWLCLLLLIAGNTIGAVLPACAFRETPPQMPQPYWERNTRSGRRK